jgi:CrcB protein
MTVVWVFLGGGLGAALRYLIGKGVAQYYAGYFPMATLLANVLSCLVLALVVFKFSNTILNQNTKLFLVVGLCGGLSTFSTFSLETLELLKTGHWPWAVVNVLLSVMTCLAILAVAYKSL